MAITDEEFDRLEELLDVKLDEKLDQKLDEKLKHLPTKDEFYTETAKIYSKLNDFEEAITITNNRSSENTDRLEKLENIHPKGKHSVAA